MVVRVPDAGCRPIHEYVKTADESSVMVSVGVAFAVNAKPRKIGNMSAKRENKGLIRILLIFFRYVTAIFVNCYTLGVSCLIVWFVPF